MANKILIIDESEHFVSTIVNRLLNYGYEYIYTAKSGAEGLDKIAVIKPNIVVLDTKLNDMDSFELCSSIKKLYKEKIKVLLMVRMTERYDPQQAEKSGADAYVIKTFDCIQLLTEIKRALFAFNGAHGPKTDQAISASPKPSSQKIQ